MTCSSSIELAVQVSLPDGSRAMAYDPASRRADEVRPRDGLPHLPAAPGPPAYGCIETRPIIQRCGERPCRPLVLAASWRRASSSWSRSARRRRGHVADDVRQLLDRHLRCPSTVSSLGAQARRQRRARARKHQSRMIARRQSLVAPDQVGKHRAWSEPVAMPVRKPTAASARPCITWSMADTHRREPARAHGPGDRSRAAHGLGGVGQTEPAQPLHEPRCATPH